MIKKSLSPPPSFPLDRLEKPVQMLPKKLSSLSSSSSMSRHAKPSRTIINNNNNNNNNTAIAAGGGATGGLAKPGATPLKLPMKLADHSASRTYGSASSAAGQSSNHNAASKSQRTEIYF